MPRCSRRWSIPQPACVRAIPASAKPTWLNACSVLSVGRLTTGGDRRPVGTVPRAGWRGWPRVWNGSGCPNGRPSSTARFEDRLLTGLHALAATPRVGLDVGVVDWAIAAEPKRLGADQADSVHVLCGEGGALRALIAPAGFGKTTALHAAASAPLPPTAGDRDGAHAPSGRGAARRRARRRDDRPVPHGMPGPAATSRHHCDRRRASQVGTRDAASISTP